MHRRSQTSFTKAYGDVTIFPGLNLSSRPPRVTREALDPNEPPLQAPAQGEPGGPAGPAGPNELGERFGLGGPGGPGGPAGPNREDGGSFPPNWFGFRNSYKDPGPGPGPNTGGGRGGGPPSASTTGGRGIGGGGPPSASTTGGRGRGGGGPPSASTTGGIGRRRGRGGGAPSALTGPANLQGNQPPANRGPPPNQGFTNNQQSQPGAHGNQGLVASSMQQTSSDSFSIDQDEGSYRGKAIHQCRVHKTAYVRKGDDVFRIQRIGDFRDENAAAFVKRAIQQEANMREDYIKAIQNWEDIDVHQRSDPFHDDDDDDDRHEADPMEIDSPDERRRQIDGFKAEIAIHSLEIHKAELVLGRGVLANFDAGLEPLSSDSKSPTLEESARIPEFSINRERDKPVAQSLRMNHLLGLEGACEIYDY
ncbi:hypothetical protein RRF57_002090 [Xylaria bambusicola]|uniref:Uncharacterized protein n=1 Tax=Xylaria bambusicola TaxID=326684 RepID=A0AAN7YVD0_9PEZI